MKKNLTLGQWLIEKTDGEAYRAGKLHGEKHPEVDQRLINKIGNLKKLLSQAEEAIKTEGITLIKNDISCDMAVISYAAYLFRKRASAETTMPRFLRYQLNNILFKQKGGAL